MSLAGVRSSQGDEYQLRVALHWLIRLLQDNSIHGLQVNSVGIPGQDFAITVDDVVVLYIDGRALCIQAKKNQPQHHSWSFPGHLMTKRCKKRSEKLVTCWRHENIQRRGFIPDPRLESLSCSSRTVGSIPILRLFNGQLPPNIINFSRGLQKLSTVLKIEHTT